MNFRKSLALLLCLALLMTSGAGAAFASAKVSAKILSLEGDVQVVRAGGEKPFAAFVNMRLTEGDRVITGTNGRAEIQMDDEVIITLVENTRIYLSELRGSAGAQQSSIGLQAGGVGSSVNKKLDENSRFEIKTPTAVMGVRGTEFFTQYFAGNIDVRVVDGIVEVTVGLTETGQVGGGGGSSWSGSGTGSGAGGLLAPGSETFTFQLGPLKQVLFGEGAQGSQLPGQIRDLTLQGMPEKFIERIKEIEKAEPGKIPESVLDKIEEAIQEALDRLREQEAAAQGTRGEYDFRYSAGIIDGDLERGLPGFAPGDMDIPPLDPEPVDTGGGGGGTSSGPTQITGLFHIDSIECNSEPIELQNGNELRVIKEDHLVMSLYTEIDSIIFDVTSSDSNFAIAYVIDEPQVGPTVFINIGNAPHTDYYDFVVVTITGTYGNSYEKYEYKINVSID
jgi:hypothetical protein